MTDTTILEHPIDILHLDGADQTTSLVERPELQLVHIEGPQGPAGPKGDPGPSGSASYVWDQAAPSASWLITHNLGVYPSVTVVDSTDRVVEGAVNYIDSNNIRVDFNAPFTGQAFLN